MTNEELLQKIEKRLGELTYIRAENIPGIDLYMDQVTTFMEQHLGSTRRFAEDKVLTKTMINNYAKNDLLPPPVNKKYSRNHLIQLIYIYYMKSFLSIGDIATSLEPLVEHFWEGNAKPSFADIYDRIFSFADEGTEMAKKDIAEKFEQAKEVFQEEDEAKQELLTRFTLLCMLDHEIYLKKQAVTCLIDEMRRELDAAAEKKGKKGKGKKQGI